MSEPVAKLTNVSFGYKRSARIVTGFCASFDSETVSVISGPSGGGKSTVLSLVGLLLKPHHGDVTVLGTSCARATDAHRSWIRRHNIGFVFQDALLETSMTVWQNLYEALPPGKATKVARTKARELLDRLELPADVLDRKALALSGGQAQRVAVVRALLKEPAIVLADEPTGNLDDTTGNIVLDTLFAYGRQNGRACVIVTHDERIVERADNTLRVEPS
jgi:ABC-type lipoprotein export system ATPase subunit